MALLLGVCTGEEAEGLDWPGIEEEAAVLARISIRGAGRRRRAAA